LKGLKMPRPQDFSQVQNFDVEDVEASSGKEEQNVVNAGEIETWKRLEIEKAKARPYITGVAMSIWVIWTIVGLIRCAIAGDISLLISSPALLVLPLSKVLNFYFTG